MTSLDVYPSYEKQGACQHSEDGRSKKSRRGVDDIETIGMDCRMKRKIIHGPKDIIFYIRTPKTTVQPRRSAPRGCPGPNSKAEFCNNAVQWRPEKCDCILVSVCNRLSYNRVSSCHIGSYCINLYIHNVYRAFHLPHRKAYFSWTRFSLFFPLLLLSFCFLLFASTSAFASTFCLLLLLLHLLLLFAFPFAFAFCFLPLFLLLLLLLLLLFASVLASAFCFCFLLLRERDSDKGREQKRYPTYYRDFFRVSLGLVFEL